MEISVPGRICLFGEHSDWAGGYRRINGEVECGYAIITGTNQRLYAEVQPHPNRFIFRSAPDETGQQKSIELPMDRAVLQAEAQKGGYFSYAAGVAFQVLTHNQVRGIEINNYKMDLPLKKGLSSSAAVCVLVARAFNRIYDLKMTTRGEMEYAYQGEITTPSRCGRLDQGCAFGDRPIVMTFDGDRIDVEELGVPSDVHIVIVDLAAEKDTKAILNRLNKAYPFADDETQAAVQKYLGPINRRIVHAAAAALRDGNAARVGALMTEAQAEFDAHLTAACPEQLEAPRLHEVLQYGPIQDLIYGGKGVGSQGDGTAQLVARDAESQQKLIEIIERDLEMPCLELVLKASRRVRKAVIPAAGFGTRLFPASKAMKKELFPVIDRDGVCKPVIMAIVEEALSAGVEEIGIIIQSRDRELFESFFNTPLAVEHHHKLSQDAQTLAEQVLKMGSRITWLTQDVQEGFGHAVYCAREWVGNEPFLLMLGDHLYSSALEESCARQLVDVYDRVGTSVVGLMQAPGESIHLFGCVSGTWVEDDRVLELTEFAEKPTREYAAEQLVVEGMDDDTYLTVFGTYVLQPRIFDYLDENIRNNVRERGEFQLTSCLDRLRREEGFSGYVVQGERLDVGVPAAYRETISRFGES